MFRESDAVSINRLLKGTQGWYSKHMQTPLSPIACLSIVLLPNKNQPISAS